MSKTHEQFVQEFENIYGNEFIVVGTYRGWNKPVDIIHNVCGTLCRTITRWNKTYLDKNYKTRI